MKPTRGFAVLTLLVLHLCFSSPLPAQNEGSQRFAEFGDFKLRSGGVIQDFRLGYRILGKLNAEKSNAVLWPTWLGGKSEDLLQFVGPGKVVDTNQFFVILADAIGNGISSSPSNSKKQPRMSFPEFTIRDMVEAEHRLATEALHLPHLRAVVGLSMGGMQAFEWAAAYPDFMDLVVTMAGSPQSTSYDKLLWTAEIDAIELDPAWNHGNPTGPLSRGIALEREIESMRNTSPAYRIAQTPPGAFPAFLEALRKGAQADGGTASNQIRQRQAILSLDIPREFRITLEQLATQVHPKLLVIVSPQDHTVNPEPAMRFAAAAHAPLVKLDSPCGHQSLACISVGPTVARFLTDPASVRGETLVDAGNH